MPRFDKYEPLTGGHRAKLAFAISGTDIGKVIGVGLDANGKVVKGAGNTGVIGLICSSVAMPIGDVIDVMQDGEIVDVSLTAGTRYYAESWQGALSATAAPASLGTVNFTDTGDVVTVSAAHGLAVNDPVIVGTVSTTTGITAGTVYYVKTVPSSTTVTLSATVGGATLALTTDGTATAIYRATTLTNKAIGWTVETDRLVARVGR